MTEANQQPTSDPSADPTSPYYIHPSDSQYKLVPYQFTGSGYNDWKRSVVISLSAKNKLVFVDGSISKPPSDSVLRKAWERVNSTLISWFIQVLDAQIARSVLYFETAKEIWENLEERFGQTSGTQLFSLQQQISELQQSPNHNVSEFYTQIKMLWDELDAAYPLPTCTCNKCTCNVVGRIHKMQQEMRLTQFLMKLNPSFNIVRGNILLQKPLPPISHAYRLLFQEEKHKEVYNANQAAEESMAFIANKKRFNETGQGQNSNFNQKTKYNNTGH